MKTYLSKKLSQAVSLLYESVSKHLSASTNRFIDDASMYHALTPVYLDYPSAGVRLLNKSR